MPNKTWQLFRRLGSPTGIALTYFLFGLIWIFISDRILESFASDGGTLSALQTYKGWAYVSITAALLYGLTLTLLARIGAARNKIREVRDNFRRLVESSHDGMWAVDQDGTILDVNARLAQIVGVPKSDLVGRGLDRFLSPAIFESVAKAGADAPRDARVVAFTRAGGERGWGVVSSVSLKDEHGTPTGQLRILTDITRTRQAEEALRMSLDAERTLLNELDHRVRNNLASLMTLIEMTRRNASGVDDFAHLIRGRVGAMAATHSLLAESKFATVDLTRLISVIAEGEQEHRLILEGPPVMLGPAQAGPVAMILQELWANSVKHGAMGSPRGNARVSWEIDASTPPRRVMRLRWKDENGPPVGPPKRDGFGLALMRGLSTSDLNGAFDAAFEPGGAAFKVEFPLYEPPRT